ncbi:unnamed protein product [Cercospora beticola]|nr:unnamed protein product [Cercospora beticola]
MDRTNAERVAIIGMSCTLPEDINDADGLWDYCARGQCSASEIPASRFKSKDFYHEDHSKRGHFNITAGSFLNQDVSAFDARFFNLNEAESTAMDPQQRLLLECTYRALENAGLDLDQLAGRSDVGVFAGASKSDYEDRMNQDPYTSSRYAATGNAMTMFANRLSYFLDVHGPSVTVDTACSSSLTALHLAVQSLQRGECSYAIVGGSFLQLSPTMLSNMGNLGTLSKDGHSYSFDQRAQGYGRGEAVSCIVLRTEAEAKSSGDPIRAIVRATGVNHGGRSPGITYPNGKAQESLIRNLYESAGLDPADTDYVEGHGTGTERGDPIEANAVLSVFRGEGHARSRPLFLGSIKSNFGHSEGASGILSVIKCVLMLERSVILPNANFEKLNPDIEQIGHALEVPTRCIPWPRDALRRTSINNFGFGGSNAHVILEQAADLPLTAVDADVEHAPALFVLSAKDAECLKSCMSELRQYLQEKEDYDDDTGFLRRLSNAGCWGVSVGNQSFDRQSLKVSGDHAAIVELAERLDAKSIFNRMLNVNVAYHSLQVVPCARQYLKDIQPWLDGCDHVDDASIVLYSSVTGAKEVGSSVRSPWYWTTNLICPVQFVKASLVMMQDLANDNCGKSVSVIEIGPHATLSGPLRETAKETLPQYFSFSYHVSMRRNNTSTDGVLELATSLVNSGARFNDEFWKTMPQILGTRLLTDLPPYPFNHSQSLWHSSRLADSHAFGGSPWNVLLGHRATNSVGDSRECRNVFTLQDIPWLREHCIHGAVVFPMAGYVSAAIEAIALENVDRKQGVEACRIREMVIGKALILSDDQDNELFTVLRPRRLGTRVTSQTGDFDFTISSWNKAAGFVEHCSGIVSVVEVKAPNAEDDAAERSRKHFDSMRHSIENETTRKIDVNAMYRQAKQQGMEYGPAFRLMSSFWTGNDAARGMITTTTAMEHENQLIINPTTLDAALHVGLCNLNSNPGRLAKLVAHVPIFVEEVYVSTAAISTTDPLEVYFHDPRAEAMGESTVGNLSCFVGPNPVIKIRNLRMKKMQQAKEELSDAESINPMKYQWFEHPNFWSDEILKRMRDKLPMMRTEVLEELERIERAALRYMQKALQQSSVPELPHLVKMKQWMTTVVGLDNLNEDDPDEIDTLMATSSVDMRCICGVGQQLPEIVRGEVDALSILKQSGLDTIYEESRIFSHSASLLAHTISQLAFENPSMRILEVGAGTGGFTRRIIEEMDSLPRIPSRFSEYWYTDISPAFIGPAQARFEKWSAKMKFQTLDICSEPSLQGFGVGEFDLVIAADVVHATPSIQQSLRNVRKLLKPGGTLALVELSRFSPFFMPFATLPGWWSRPEGPILSNQEWHDELVEAGLTGCHAYVEDMKSGGTHCLIWSHARHEVPDDSPGKVSIICEHANAARLCEQELTRAKSNTDPAIHSSLAQIIDTDMRLSIVVEEASKCSLLNPEPGQLEAIQYMCAKAEGILWVIRSSSETAQDSAVAGLAFGFARTVRLEYRQLKFVMLNIVDTGELDAMAVVGKVFRHTFIDKPGRQETDVDLVWEKDRLLYPRLLSCDWGSSGQRAGPLQLTMDRIGLLDSLHFSAAPRTLLEDPLGDDEVIIEIKATGLNFRDVLIALGRVPWTSPGKECSGVVAAAGCKAGLRYQKGDRVVHLGDGLFATHARCNITTIARIPDGSSLGFSEAASIPIIFCTAYESLVCRANLQPKEKILIHAAAGGVGQAAIQIAQQLGAEIYCTVGSPEKKKFMIDHYNINPSRIFSSRSTDFVEGLQFAADGGVDVVLNSLSEDLLQASWRCLAPLGRFIDIGKRDALANSALEMAPFDKGVTYSAVQLDVLMLQRSDRTKQLLDTVMENFAHGTWKPVHLAEKFSVGQLESAMRLMQSGKHIGKIIINNDRDARVPLRGTKAARMSEIRRDVTYLITGGTSGLASSLSRWLVEKGAKHIVLASRSGDARSASAQELMEYARTRGATISMEQCDVGSEAQVADLRERIEREGMPKLRGVIHGAMVLKDTMFSSLTAGEWNAVLRPKVQGVLNLYYSLRTRSLDFFVCLSSVAAVVGNVGQAPYSAANEFMDRFCAWWSRQNGQKAISINLPSISDVGYVAEAIEAGITAFSDKVYAASLSEEAVCKVMDAALQDNGKKSDSWDHQRSNNVVVGIPQVPALRPIIEEVGPALSIMKHSMDALSREESQGSSVSISDTTRQSVAAQLSNILEPAERKSVIQANLRKRIAAITLRDLENIASESAIADLGLDSLVTVELHSWILKELDARVTVMEIIGFQTFKQLVDIVCERSPLINGKS